MRFTLSAEQYAYLPAIVRVRSAPTATKSQPSSLLSPARDGAVI